MTTHLSMRILWHDRGWDGRVCDCPVENSSCLIQQHVRESRDDDLEMKNARVPVTKLDGWQPPCARDINAFSELPSRITHHDPLDWRALPSVSEDIPPYSLCPAPYRWMREEYVREVVEKHQIELPPPTDLSRERGWVNEPKRQRMLLDRFWDELEEGNSLVFLYCNRGNPIENGPSRLLVGASRLKELGRQMIFGKTPEYGADHPVWTRLVTHAYPKEGVRLPLQEYLREGRSPSQLICPAPEGGLLAFSYVAEHVPDDLAVGALERLVQAVEAVKRDGLVDRDWDASLAWLDEALSETWKGRGLLPGIGSVLRALGMERGIGFQRAELSDPSLSRSDLWAKAESLLEGFSQPDDEPRFYDSLKRARQKWRALPPERKALMALLGRYELSVDQVARISEPRKRRESGIVAESEQEIIDNPYLLFEQDEGTADSDRIALETVDRGVALDRRQWAGEETPPLDDLTRVRAAMVAVLEEAAKESGDTFLTLDELLDRVEHHFPDRRRCETDLDVVLGNLEFLGEALALDVESEPHLVALPRIAEAETVIREVTERRWRRTNDPPPTSPWEKAIDNYLKEEDATPLTPEVEDRARAEKVAALERLQRRRLSVLTGRAGTGKTSVVSAFLDGLEEIDGSETALLLAPTGKARVRLATKTRRRAETIHQFLLRNEWLSKDTLAIRMRGGRQQGAATVVVDEASMISVDLLGALFRALDMNEVKRLILVGDPNQLPPIGPGRPFVDLIAWLDDDDERRQCLAELRERARHEDANSRALQLADGFLSTTPPAGDDELLASVAREESEGDLEVRFYESANELRGELWAVIDDMVGAGKGQEAYRAFTDSLVEPGPVDKGQRAESWQVLSPVRVGSGGTDDLNRQIQQRYKAGLLSKGRSKRGTFGDEEIVWTDKVIQTVNRRRRGWPQSTGLDYVANGEIGIVCETDRNGEHLDIAFSTQKDVTYRYWGGDDVDEQLRLAYAITVHKAQGSDFDTVVVILPMGAPTLSRELLYTALTRFRKRVILLAERDVSVLAEFRRPERSEVVNRNSNLFEPQFRPEEAGRPYRNKLIHQAGDGTLVRSKSELVILEKLLDMGMSVRYEERLISPNDPDDFRLPDFTVRFEGDTYYWEHLGMLDVSSYARSWERKRGWYERNGFIDRVISSADGPGVGLRVPEIEARAERRIVRGAPRDETEPGF